MIASVRGRVAAVSPDGVVIEVGGVGLAVACFGIGGLIYMAIPVWRMWHQHVYRPDLEDLTFHVLLPVVAYGLLAATGVPCLSRMEWALFCVGGAALLLLFIGIHNSWDAVAYHVYVQRTKQADKP